MCMNGESECPERYKRSTSALRQEGPLTLSSWNDTHTTTTLPNGVEIFIYADDVCLVSTDRHRSHQNMQSAIIQIENKCKDLGLKINTAKTKAMAIKHSLDPDEIELMGEPIEWVDNFVYLGVNINKQLSPRKDLKILKQKVKCRHNAMRRITSLQQGAYITPSEPSIQTIRSTVEYAAPVLTSLSSTEQKCLEVIQNNALRLITGAPMWTNLCILRHETKLQSLTYRIDQKNTSILLKTLKNEREPVTKKRDQKVH
ncbi:uncharacterized protein LOC135219078 [Macrobrachium nipponense]|uniref:uncharacterized protein LOC135219078 n=1 Tax=Macrobrachium nipponense TaxID=159736 RepID=UPI0030C7AF62